MFGCQHATHLRVVVGQGRRGSDPPALTTGTPVAAFLSHTGWHLHQREMKNKALRPSTVRTRNTGSSDTDHPHWPFKGGSLKLWERDGRAVNASVRMSAGEMVGARSHCWDWDWEENKPLSAAPRPPGGVWTIAAGGSGFSSTPVLFFSFKTCLELVCLYFTSFLPPTFCLEATFLNIFSFDGQLHQRLNFWKWINPSHALKQLDVIRHLLQYTLFILVPPIWIWSFTSLVRF